MNDNAKWIWYTNNQCGTEMILFRKEIQLDQTFEQYQVDISADSKYIVYINGTAVSRGPCKADRYRQYFYTVDIAPYLKQGANVLAAAVIHFEDNEIKDYDFLTGPISVVSAPCGGLFIRERDQHYGLSTDSTFSCIKADFYRFEYARESRYLGYFERTDFRRYPNGWLLPGFDDSQWMKSQELIEGSYCVSPFGHANVWNLMESPIPCPYEETRDFKGLTRFQGLSGHEWENIFHDNGVIIQKGSRVWAEIDAGEYVTAFPSLLIEGGNNSTITILYSECYQAPEGAQRISKQVRDDCSGNAVLYGEEDGIVCSDATHTFISAHYRSFRFIRIEIQAEETLRLSNLHFIKTGYPLAITGTFGGDDIANRLWNVSVRTLLSCMYDTYIDCPFYEQMQYVMDSLLEMIYTFQLSADDRMARKAIFDFHSAQLPNGIIPCNAPAKTIQIIPGFSLYFVLMVSYHHLYYGDDAFTKGFLGTIDRLLQYFFQHIDPADGLLKKTGYWEFVDWVQEWEVGCPLESEDDVNIIYNMILVYALKEAASLNIAVGRKDTADEYLALAQAVSDAVQKYAYDPSDGLFYDVPLKEKKSQHAQVWAVLSGIVSGDRAKDLMKKCLSMGELCQCSYSMSFFLFRALEMVGLYGETQKLWDTWTNLLSLNLTTWPEDPVSQRSDCHAWGALPLYEFSANVLGIKPAAPGYRKVHIEPKALWVEQCHGTVASCIGDIEVTIQRRGDAFALTVDAPRGADIELVMPDGTKHDFVVEEAARRVVCSLEDSDESR